MTEEAGCWSAGTVWAGTALATARLRLRPFTHTDAPRLAAVLDDWDMAKYTANIPHPYHETDAHAFILLQEQRRQLGQGAGLALERTTDKQVIGAIGFTMDPDGSAELGYWVAREAWGQGYATEALRRLIRHLFADLGIARLWAMVHPDNPASKTVLGKAGFLPDGHSQCAVASRGCSVVSPRFALTADQWKATHAARPMLLVAAAALIDTDGRVLMASRPPGKMMAGLWEFPGGKVHDGETPEAALIRELHEELGIDVGESCLAPLAFASYDYDTFHLLMPLYAVRTWKGSPIAKEGQGLKWVRPARMGEMPMPPADIPLVAILREWV
ncbi:NTP pyrophosphohydrolase [Magnetospirillum moscoviense]|uniref:8-oxo-dGTP diphosphatase n=2 Tax=Magnetospirillum moscoviense TaxID=1437059 RepID=A0A178M6P1_9PROT|nr:bifunctional GNAT family N-acetyltransferase/(deoxy)nucleoside triphosphate pyrophosphohydrolase [Magnetospirillum moscoviense]OAN43718.1 NTP pyrophosphohydrolase [Magnetospirillum moscoviense]